MRRLAATLGIGVFAIAASLDLAKADDEALIDGVTTAYALAEFGEPALEEGFTHFPYANPEAPKGGSVRLAAVGGFDSLNPIPLQGDWPRNIGLLTASLMVESQDEVSVYYPWIAESIDYPENLSWAIFNLRPEARFHDGSPITAADIVWTFEMIRAHARPFLRAFYEDIIEAEALDPQRVRFTFATQDSMRPLTRAAVLPAYSERWWSEDGRDISSTILEPPLGSGPYRLVDIDPGRSLTYERVTDYWAADLPINRGLYNFDQIVYDYYSDSDIMFEAFKAGEYDFRHEGRARNWIIGYDTAAVEEGHIQRQTVQVVDFRGMAGLFFNTRLPMFEDRRVRLALAQVFPFSWVNENIMYDTVERIDSYFIGDAAYQAVGLPEGQELELLEPFRDQLPPELFSEPYVPADIEGGVSDRGSQRTALRLLQEAGWELRNGRMTQVETGTVMSFEILLQSATLEPHIQPLVQNLERLGIDARLRWVESAQFQRRFRERSFEVVSLGYTFFPPPGEELVSRFSSAEADVPGSANLAGIRDPVVDSLIAAVLESDDIDNIAAATRALNRVLLWGHYVIPFWDRDDAWIAYWNMFGFPGRQPPYSFGAPNSIGFQPTWWVDADLAASLDGVR